MSRRILFVWCFTTAILFGNPIAHADTKDSDIYDGTRALLKTDLHACSSRLGQRTCLKIFSLTGNGADSSFQDSLFYNLAFGDVYELAKLCHNNSNCKILESKTCDAFHAGQKKLCEDLNFYLKKQCSLVEEPFLKSLCGKTLVEKCQKDLACSIPWALAVSQGPSSELLSQVHPSIKKAILHEQNERRQDLLKIRQPIQGERRQQNELTKILTIKNFPVPAKAVAPPAKENKIARHSITEPKFQIMARFPFAFKKDNNLFLQPWRRGTGLTVTDWNGDGRLDILTVSDKTLSIFENLGAGKFAQRDIDLSDIVRGLGLTDVSALHLWGPRAQILVQDFPHFIHILSFDSPQTLTVQTVELPNNSRTHALVKMKDGFTIVFPGWNGIRSAPNEMAKDYVSFVKNKKFIFETLPESSMTPTLSIGVLTKKGEPDKIVINKDLEGPSQIYEVKENALVRSDVLQMPSLSHSTVRLNKQDGQSIDLITGVGFPNLRKKNTGRTPPAMPHECSHTDIACLLAQAKNKIYPWSFLCERFSTQLAELCQMQFSDNRGLQSTNLKSFFWENKVSTKPSQPDLEKSIVQSLHERDQIWHMAPISLNNGLEGFILAEASLNEKVQRRLLLLRIQAESSVLTELNLPKEIQFDSYNFALADFDNDGEPDIAFRSGQEFIILKGKWDGQSTLNENTQSGYMSRYLQQIPDAD